MITVMVPALNEELYLRDTVRIIIRAAESNNVELDIVIVNDGSTDKTPDITDELEKNFPFVRSIHNKKNLGIGRSLAKVVKIAKGDKFLIVGGDGDMSENDVSNLLSNMDKAEMIFLYFLNKEARGRFRNLLSLLYNAIHILFFDLYVQYVSGPCIYPMEKLRKLDIKSGRFSIVAELSIKLLHLGCTYYEVPGYMQKGTIGSSAISIKNFLEVCGSFVRLMIEIKISNRRIFNRRPRRIY